MKFTTYSFNLQNEFINKDALTGNLQIAIIAPYPKAGTNQRYIQTAMGHSSSKTTEIYTHVLKINNKQVESPLDILLKKHTFEEKKNSCR